MDGESTLSICARLAIYATLKADPDIKLSYSSPANGVGAANDFDGNGKVGSGRAEIVESVHPSRIVMALRMVRDR
jgi:hypothetical protein